jgi:hypothetical protein
VRPLQLILGGASHLFRPLRISAAAQASRRAPVDGPVHNRGAPGDNRALPVEGENSSGQLAENPCQAGEVSLEIIYVTGNGDPHRTSGTAGSAPPGQLGSSEPAKSGVRHAGPPTTEARQRRRRLQRSAALGSQVVRGKQVRRLVNAATREPSEAPPTHTWRGLTPFPAAHDDWASRRRAPAGRGLRAAACGRTSG